MASTYGLYDVTGAGATKTLIGDGASPAILVWCFKNNNATSGIGTSADAVAREDLRSYPGYICARFTGTFTSITSVKFWMTDIDLTGLGDTAEITAIDTDSYSNPASNADVGDPTVPTTYAGALDVSTAGLAAGAAGYSDYIRLQLFVDEDATIAYYTALGVINFKWTEV